MVKFPFLPGIFAKDLILPAHYRKADTRIIEESSMIPIFKVRIKTSLPFYKLLSSHLHMTSTPKMITSSLVVYL